MTLRAAGGYSTAVAFVIGSALVARLRPSLLPIYFAGPGLGVVISSLLVPAALTHDPGGGWKLGWILLGAVEVSAALGVWRVEAAVPEHERRQAATLTVQQFRKLGPMFAA